MNPGPWGMVQSGVPFGEVAAVRDWMKIKSSAKQPKSVHPKRPIEGLSCKRSEVSGRRLWGLFANVMERRSSFSKRILLLTIVHWPSWMLVQRI